MFFGEPWDAPAVDDGTPVPTPVGQFCQQCPDAIAEGDQGFLVSTVRLGEDGEPVGSLEPVHRECLVRATVGAVACLEGRCGGPSHPHDDDRSFREQGRETIAWLQTRGTRHVSVPPPGD